MACPSSEVLCSFDVLALPVATLYLLSYGRMTVMLFRDLHGP